MRTAIRENDSAEGDLGFDTVPRVACPPARSRTLARPDGDPRRPRGDRPRSAVVRYDRPRTELSRGPHPAERVERARLGFATLAVAALVSAAVVCGLIGVAQLRAGAPARESTQTVQVGEGESLSEVAVRVAPGAPVRDTVRKIVELNGLRGSEVTSGRTLIVPASER
ncbi:LysM peptidoglycan-binding domain-containing protein [Nocardia blacklockiae]|uniref:LysM peptidoglycan-binding domain-containing protein n=1 Tax=Nocardia blacklockiae TaxID=480036 RepID=UPI0018950558|nr:LysM peptidoglycan-binding domain-containing protein [Nocardia blacklockiae]MBF6176761.1 LysM peptidoglycan-binding domain-containing protein [Nocardia blacklockiae]